MDRRVAVYRVIAECRALDTANDVLALSQEGRLRLVQAHSAHIQNDWSAYLDAVDRLGWAAGPSSCRGLSGGWHEALRP